MRHLLTTLVVALTLTIAPAFARATAGEEDLVVIVNPANPAIMLARDELRPIFQTTRLAWPDGTRAEPLNLPDEVEARRTFDRAVLGLDPDRVSRYWVDRKIRGGERPPRRLTATSAVVRNVAADKGAVGYVPEREANATVKIVARIQDGKLVPFDPLLRRAR